MASRPFFPVAIFALLVTQAGAVLFDSTADPAFNTSAPTGSLANSGWQYQGQWSATFLGTPIAPHFFITAKHVNGNIGDKFHFQGVDYTTTAKFDDPDSDLRIWQVAETFPTFAPLYPRTDEVGKELVVVGRGTQRGAEVRLGGVLKGWLWGTADLVQRWGTNTVAAIYPGGSGMGDLLQAKFERGVSKTECALSIGDSSGGVFIKDGPVWKLAGISFVVDGPYSTSSDGSNSFNAALFDRSGFFEHGASGWYSPRGPASWYATRISSHLKWIASIIGDANAAAAATKLQSNAPVYDRTSALGSLSYNITVPQGATHLTVTLRGGSGNGDLYLKFGTPPTPTDFDYATSIKANRDTLRVKDPLPGDWFILVNAAPTFDGVMLLARFTLGPGLVAPPIFLPSDGTFPGQAVIRIASATPGAQIFFTTDGSEPDQNSTPYKSPVTINQNTTLKAKAFRKNFADSVTTSSNIAITPANTITDLISGVAITNLAGTGTSDALFRIAVPSGQNTLIIDNYGTSGAADIYVKRGATPTSKIFDYHLHPLPGHERLAIPDPAADDWYILLQGRRPFSGAALKAETQ